MTKFIALESLTFKFCNILDFEEVMRNSYQPHANIIKLKMSILRYKR